MNLEIEHSPATLSAITYKIRVGNNSSTGITTTINGLASARIFGGASQATLIIEEIYA